MSGRYSTLMSLQYHQKVVHNLSFMKSPEVSKMIKRHAKIVDNLRKKIKTKGWAIA